MVWMHRMRVLVTLSMSMFLIWGSAACGGEGEQQAAVTEVNFDAKDFPEPTKIDNKYHPLVPGTKYFFEGSKKGVPFRTETVISQETKVVNGVTTRVIHDSDFGLGQLVETTEDWFAQDKKGNLWYMGEYATQYDSGQVTRFRTGLIAAKNSTKGKKMMEFLRMTGFEAIPSDFDELTVSVAKAYPPK